MSKCKNQKRMRTDKFAGSVSPVGFIDHDILGYGNLHTILDIGRQTTAH